MISLDTLFKKFKKAGISENKLIIFYNSIKIMMVISRTSYYPALAGNVLEEAIKELQMPILEKILEKNIAICGRGNRQLRADFLKTIIAEKKIRGKAEEVDKKKEKEIIKKLKSEELKLFWNAIDNLLSQKNYIVASEYLQHHLLSLYQKLFKITKGDIEIYKEGARSLDMILNKIVERRGFGSKKWAFASFGDNNLQIASILYKKAIKKK